MPRLSSLAELIEMRYFGGMNAKETAEVVGCSVAFCLENLLHAHGQRRLFVVPPGVSDTYTRCGKCPRALSGLSATRTNG